jgi:hypothetical protein
MTRSCHGDTGQRNGFGRPHRIHFELGGPNRRRSRAPPQASPSRLSPDEAPPRPGPAPRARSRRCCRAMPPGGRASQRGTANALPLTPRSRKLPRVSRRFSPLTSCPIRPGFDDSLDAERAVQPFVGGPPGEGSADPLQRGCCSRRGSWDLAGGDVAVQYADVWPPPLINPPVGLRCHRTNKPRQSVTKGTVRRTPTAPSERLTRSRRRTDAIVGAARPAPGCGRRSHPAGA